MNSNTHEDLARMEALTGRLLEMINGNWRTQALYVACELGLPDQLSGGAKTVEAIAQATQTHEPSLFRLLRALEAMEICRRVRDRSFELTELGALLCSDSAGTLRNWTRWTGRALWPLWGKLLESVKTGQSARKLLLGTEGFAHLETDPEAAAIFDQALAEMGRLSSRKLVAACALGGSERIVDVGGGRGDFLAALLSTYRNTRGVLFDRPHAIQHARSAFEVNGLAKRCEFVEGDFFVNVPSGADVYILKSVIHDWKDEDSRRILANCRKAMEQNGRILIFELVMPERMESTPAHQSMARSDLNMLVAHGSGERTVKEMEALLNSAGLRMKGVGPTGMTYSIVEAIGQA